MTLPSRYVTGAPIARGPMSGLPYIEVDPPTNDLAEMLRKLRRHLKLIVASMVVCAIAAAIAVSMMQPQYAASAQVLVGVPEPNVLSKSEAVMKGLPPDAEIVRNESYVLASPGVAKVVIDKLALDQDPEFNPYLRERSMWWYLSAFLQDAFDSLTGDADAATTRASDEGIDRRQQAVVNTVLSKVEVEPLARSYVLSVRTESADPVMAYKLANAFVNVYVDQQRGKKWQATHDAEIYLKKRIDEMQREVAKSDQAVEDYRRRTGLLRGATSGVTEQQLTELNTQLIMAQAAVAEAEARLREAQALAKRPDATDTIPAVLSSPTIQKLKEQQLEVQRKIAELSSTYGDRHPRMINARAEGDEVRQKIGLEVNRIIAGLRNEAGTAKARYDALHDNFTRLKTEMGAANEKSIELQALEREAEANRTLLESMLARYKETVAQQELVQPDAQVIREASVPNTPAFPPRILLIAVAAMGGLVIGVILAMVVENFDRTFRRPDEVEEATGLPTLAVVPTLTGRGKPANQVLDKPVSAFSDALRRLYISLQTDSPTEPARLIMVASAVPREGKSLLCASLARLLAASGRRVLLIDCDWRRPSQHRIFGGRKQGGLAAVLNGEAPLKDVIHHDTASGAHLLFAGAPRAQNIHLLNSELMRRLLVELANAYDAVILDTPPVLVGAETLHLSRVVDKTVFLVRWGQTPREVALDALKQLSEAHARVAGVAMTQVNSDRYRYYSYGQIDYGYGKAAFASSR